MRSGIGVFDAERYMIKNIRDALNVTKCFDGKPKGRAFYLGTLYIGKPTYPLYTTEIISQYDY